MCYRVIYPVMVLYITQSYVFFHRLEIVAFREYHTLKGMKDSLRSQHADRWSDGTGGRRVILAEIGALFKDYADLFIKPEVRKNYVLHLGYQVGRVDYMRHSGKESPPESAQEQHPVSEISGTLTARRDYALLVTSVGLGERTVGSKLAPTDLSARDAMWKELVGQFRDTLAKITPDRHTPEHVKRARRLLGLIMHSWTHSKRELDAYRASER